MNAIIDYPERVRAPLDFLSALLDTEECRQYCEVGHPGSLVARVVQPSRSFEDDPYAARRPGLSSKLDSWREEWCMRFGGGWCELGQGAFSIALAPREMQERVLVVSLEMDPAKETWMCWCMHNQDNPFVPRIYLTGEDKCGRWYWMERLFYPSLVFRPSSETSDLIHALGTMLSCDGIPEQARKHPKLVECLSFCLDTGHDLDLHSGNIMMRGDQIVIIDPIC